MNWDQEPIDISPLLSEKTAVFPGDTPLSLQRSLSFSQGHHLELSSLTTTPHLGAHADASIHYHPQGEGIEARSLKHYLGPCQVVAIEGLRVKERIRPEHLPGGFQAQAKRLLFRTDSHLNTDQWTDDFNSLSPELLDLLAAQGVITVGIDSPSVDPADSKDLPSHQALWRHQMAVLEGLKLDQVAPGLYVLVALPLKLKGLDASPVRAILLKRSPAASRPREAEGEGSSGE